MEIFFTDEAWEDYLFWNKTDKRFVRRINSLIENIKETPFHGLGKPEPLKHQFSGTWSRRIDKKHRLIYLIKSEKIWIISCLGHYK